MKKAFKNFPSLGRGLRGEGFTLAEVLITLMIIGIVAALTIPSVISNYQQQEFKTGLKKAVSVLNEAIQTNIATDGETPYENKDLFTYLQRHMNVIKSDNGKHIVEESNGDGTRHMVATKNAAFYTTDGMRYELISSAVLYDANIKLHESNVQIINYSMYGNCGSYGLVENRSNTTETPCFLLVDVNGDKRPTRYDANAALIEGSSSVIKNYLYPSPQDKKLTDIFPILITDQKAIPFGVVAQRAMYSK